MTERTENYVMTIDPSKKADKDRLEAVRDAIKTSNRALGTRLSIKCHGRLGKGHPKAAEYKSRKTSTVKLADATRWDVYLFSKGETKAPTRVRAASKKSMASRMSKKPTAAKKTTRKSSKR